MPESESKDGPNEAQEISVRQFSQLARTGKNSPLRYLASLPFLVFMYFVGAIVFSVVPTSLARSDGDPSTYVDESTLEVVGYPITEFSAFALSFLTVWLGLFVAVKYIHRRPFLTLVNAACRVNWGRLGQGFAVYFILFAGAFAVGYLLQPQILELAVEPGRLLVFIPVVLALIPIQATAEELFCRGYLLQLFGLATSNVVVLSLVTGTLFALPHLGNPEAPALGEGLWVYFADMLIFGFLMAAVTLEDGGIELAVGAHIATNVLGFTLVNYDETLLDTPSVFELLDTSVSFVDLSGTAIISVLFYLLVFKVFRRKETVEYENQYDQYEETG